jgi:hypothetical protein
MLKLNTPVLRRSNTRRHETKVRQFKKVSRCAAQDRDSCSWLVFEKSSLRNEHEHERRARIQWALLDRLLVFFSDRLQRLDSIGIVGTKRQDLPVL